MKSHKVLMVTAGLAVTCGVTPARAHGQDSGRGWQRIQRRSFCQRGEVSALPRVIRDQKISCFSACSGGLGVARCPSRFEIVDITWSKRVIGLCAGRGHISASLGRNLKRVMTANSSDPNTISSKIEFSKVQQLHPAQPTAKQNIVFALRRSAQPAELKALNYKVQSAKASVKFARLGRFYIDQLGSAMRR